MLLRSLRLFLKFIILVISLIIVSCPTNITNTDKSSDSSALPEIAVEKYLTMENGSLDANGLYTEGIYTCSNFREGTGLIPVITAAVSKKGSYSISFTCDTSTDTARLKDRTELTLVKNIPMGTEKCTSFSFRLTDDFPRVSNWFLIHQWHQSAPESPPFAIEIKPGTDNILRAVVRYGVDVNSHIKLDFDTQIVKGQWIDVFIIWKVDTSMGIFKIWVNGNKILDYSGPAGYTGVADLLIDEKFGVYRDNQNIKHTVYYDEIKYGSVF